MKKFTHPIKRQTRIRFNNGSSFNNYWNYYRSVLNADNNNKSIENISKKANLTFIEVLNSDAGYLNAILKLSKNKPIIITNTQGFVFEFTFNSEIPTV